MVLLFNAMPLLAEQTPAQPTSTQSNSATAPPTETLTEAQNRAAKAEREAMILREITGVERSVTSNNFASLAIVLATTITLFGALITGLVVFFAIRTERAAVARAENITKEGTKDLREEISGQVKASRALANQVTASAEKVSEAEQRMEDVITRAETGAIGIEGILSNLAEKLSTGEKDISENLKKRLRAATDLAEASRDNVEEKDDPETWSVSRFKVEVGNALYGKEDPKTALSLTKEMAKVYADDEDALIYAWNHQGDALVELGNYKDAITAYQKTIDHLSENTSDRLWAWHHKAHALLQMGQAKEAELQFRKLLDIRRDVEKPDAPDTLAAWHGWAAALLNIGQAEKAEAQFRELLDVQRKIEKPDAPDTLATWHLWTQAMLNLGQTKEARTEFEKILNLEEETGRADHSDSLVTRYWFALATLRCGDAARAEEILAVIPEEPENQNWLSRWQAMLCFVRGQVDDALGKHDAATQWLKQAEDIYADIYPPGHLDRKKLDEYLPNRDVGDERDGGDNGHDHNR